MPYVAEKPGNVPSPDSLRNRIPGWGVDLDPKDRPAVPKENFNPQGTGAHWHFPERQKPRWLRERSSEHSMLTPVFGTSCPPKGLSGRVRRYAYQFSEGRLSHWLLLMGADRIDVLENRMAAWLRGRPSSRVREMGVLSEFKRGGVRSRVGQRRADLKHQWIDVAYFAAPYVAMAGVLYLLGRSGRRHAQGSPQRRRRTTVSPRGL